MKYFKTVIISLILLQNLSFAQADSINKRKLNIYIGGNVLLYSGTFVALNKAWYEDYNKVKFHSFDDSGEWLQMDKAGHTFSAYYLSLIQYNWLRNVGFSNKKSLLIGSALAFTYISTVEIFDGFSENWGASFSDLTANFAGVALFSAQQYFWQKQIISLKFSFHTTQYPQYRSELLGENTLQQILKDYNGQTYWLSVNLKSIFKNSKIPSFINIAFGYGAEGMIGGHSNPQEIENMYPKEDWNRRRQFYLSPDIDFTKIKTRKKWLKTIFSILNVVKVPMPAVEFENNKVNFYYLLF